jgi:TPR repeat protein
LLILLFVPAWPFGSSSALQAANGTTLVTEEQRLMVDAFRYYTGTKAKVNLAKALSLYRRAAELGNPEAQYILGGMYYRGMGTDIDEQEAFKWFLRAAESGHSSPQSLTIIGSMYLRGIGVPQNYIEALKYHRLAAEQGSRQARNELAYMYYNGLGTKQDFDLARFWYQEAALQGDNQAQYNLGMLYATGTGVSQDNVKAYAWYSIAASTGNTGAMVARNALMPLLSWEELNSAQAEAVDLYREIVARQDLAGNQSEELSDHFIE